tara:strand:+ start:683 stop:1009 length:327 start_codon:yes stop_codon:yes gene_type:complete
MGNKQSGYVTRGDENLILHAQFEYALSHTERYVSLKPLAEVTKDTPARALIVTLLGVELSHLATAFTVANMRELVTSGELRRVRCVYNSLRGLLDGVVDMRVFKTAFE